MKRRVSIDRGGVPRLLMTTFGRDELVAATLDPTYPQVDRLLLAPRHGSRRLIAMPTAR